MVQLCTFMLLAYSYNSHFQTSNCFIRHLPSSLNKQSSYSSLRYLRRYPLPCKVKTLDDRFAQGHFKCNAAKLFQQVSSSCVIQRSSGAAFLCCSVRKPALPNQNQEVTAPSLSIRRFLACYVQSQRPSDYPPAATPGAPFIPMGKDAMTPWIFFSSRPPFYHKSHYVTRFLR